MAEPLLRMAPALLRREAARRRTILLTLAGLLVFGVSPVFAHHLPVGLEHVLAGRDHLWALCLVALHALLGPVHDAFHLLFLAGLTYAVWDRTRAWRSSRAALRAVATRRPRHGDAFALAARAAGVDPAGLVIVPGLPTPAFTTGWLRPRIYAAAALADQLSPDELAAVLAHEAVHVRRRDPLRLSALRFLACVLFWMPALRRVAADYAAENEVRADDAAAGKHGLALAAALVTLADWQAPATDPAVVGFTGGDLLERRVLRLTGVDVPPCSRLTRGSLVGAAAALLLAWSAGLAGAHPPPAGAERRHCDRHERAVVFHLFCAFGHTHGPEEACPHDVANLTNRAQ